MITFIVGETGSGKTSLATYLLQEKYLNEGNDIWERSCNLIRSANEKYGRHYSLPDKVPFYTNYNIKLHVGYNEYYEPYYQNGYYFGVANEVMDTQFVALGGVVVFDESQRILNSRKSSSFADFVSYAFEVHRQAQLEVILIAQRGKLLDCNVRELGVHVIQIVRMENEKDAAGNVVRTTWHCREFENWTEAERYQQTGEGEYRETEYVNEGSIFECYDSYEHVTDFLPPQGKDFSYLPHEKPKRLSEREKQFYNAGEPKNYRNNPKNDKNKKEKKTA